MRDRSIDWDTLDRLTNWYLANGATGLFACCTSSETAQLSEPERLKLAARVVARAGRVPVVAAGVPGREPVKAADFITRLADTGVAAVVLTACQLADEKGDDERWLRNAEAILAAAPPAIPLGLYESPVPYWRHLTPVELRWAVGTGRFVFLKDTSCSMDVMRERIPIVRGSRLRLYNAHAALLSEAIAAGADGFCGIAANAWPGLCAWLVTHATVASPLRDQVRDFIKKYELLLAKKYPASGKVLASLAGVPIQTVCRARDVPFTPDELKSLEAARHAADQLLASL
jgi:4-hydroxy-tetrahydrodipicolinate synthase